MKNPQYHQFLTFLIDIIEGNKNDFQQFLENR